jgi:hypothetical protein
MLELDLTNCPENILQNALLDIFDHELPETQVYLKNIAS